MAVNEIDGLMKKLLYVDSPPASAIRLSRRLEDHAGPMVVCRVYGQSKPLRQALIHRGLFEPIFVL